MVIFSHVNQWQSVKWANKYKILILNSHFRRRKLRLSYQGTKNVAIYAFSSGKILDVRKVAGVKDLTNIMSACRHIVGKLLTQILVHSLQSAPRKEMMAESHYIFWLSFLHMWTLFDESINSLYWIFCDAKMGWDAQNELVGMSIVRLTPSKKKQTNKQTKDKTNRRNVTNKHVHPH